MIQLTASAFRGVRNGSEREGAAHPRSPPLCLGRQASSQTAPRIFLRDSHPRAPPAPPRARPSRPNRGAPGRVTQGGTPSERPPQASPSYRAQGWGREDPTPRPSSAQCCPLSGLSRFPNFSHHCSTKAPQPVSATLFQARLGLSFEKVTSNFSLCQVTQREMVCSNASSTLDKSLHLYHEAMHRTTGP